MTLYSLPPLLTLACFLGLAGLTVRRGRRSPSNRLFLILCILGSLLYIDILLIFNVTAPRTALWISRCDHLLIVYLLPLYIHFFHVYLRIRGYRWLLRLAYGYAFVLMCFVPTPLFIADMQRHAFGYFAQGGPLYPFFGVGGLAVTLYVLSRLYHAMGSATVARRKNQLGYVFAGFGTMGLMVGLNVLPIIGYAIYPIGNFSFIPLLVFAFGLFKHDLLDMGAYLRRGLLYSMLSAVLTALYVLLILAAERVFSGIRVWDSFAFGMLFFLVVAFVLGPLKSRMQAFIDRLLIKDKYDYQKTIRHVSRVIASVLDLAEISRRLMDVVVNVMRVDHCQLFVADSNRRGFIRSAARGGSEAWAPPTRLEVGCALIGWMTAERQIVVRSLLAHPDSTDAALKVGTEMGDLNAEIALPMVFKGQLNGVMLLGEKFSGDLFSPQDLDLLETLATQSALAIENARSYRKVENLNQNLEHKVADRTRALESALTEKEKTQEQLIRSESLAAIGQLVAGTAHELNNPLTSVKSLVQSTIEDLAAWNPQSPPDPDLVADLQFADRELGRAKAIVASLLDLSRQTQTYAEAVDINAVVKDAVRILYNQFKREPIEIHERYGSEVPEVRGNFANLGQVVLNIVRNALQAVQARGGNITLGTAFDPTAAEVVFTCRDDGPGVPAAIRQDIFKPFFTTKPVGQGTGLGLYICHEIVRRHGGVLSLEERAAGQGAAFVLRLPVPGPESIAGSSAAPAP